MIEIRLSRWQSQVWDDGSRFKVVNCGRRAGKTTLVAAKATAYAMQNNGSVVWYVAPTYRQAKQIFWEMMAQTVPPDAIEKKNETELILILKNGSRIELKGAENPDSLRGVRIDLCFFDEVAFFSDFAEAFKIIRPTLIDSKADAWYISTPNGFNHFKDLSDMARSEDGYSYFHFTSYDNPHLSHEELEELRAQMDEDSFSQEIMAEFRKMSGLIYKEFSRDTHMVDLPSDIHDTGKYTYARAIDFGYAHKTALPYFAVRNDGKAIYLYDAIYESGLVEKDIASIAKQKQGGRYFSMSVADSENPLAIENMRREGESFDPVKKGKDSVKHGIGKVSELLQMRNDTGKPTLMIAKHLTFVADEFERYRWAETHTTGQVKEVPYKVDDDMMDGIRYFAVEWEQRAVRVDVRVPEVNLFTKEGFY